MSEKFRFEPTSHQLKFAEIYLDTGKSLTQGKIAAELGVIDRTIRSKTLRSQALNFVKVIE